MRCIIVDDDEMSRLHLAKLCERIDTIEIIGAYSDALSAYHFLEKNEVDLIFLDIEMPDFTGIELVEQLINPPAIIFITSKEIYAAKTFDFIETIVDYLIKPVSLSRLLKSIKRYEEHGDAAISPAPVIENIPQSTTLEVLPKHLFVKADRKYIRIDLDNLLYIETVGDYSIFKTTEKQYIVHATLKSINKRLQHHNFFKVHRSFIVNIDKIKDIEDGNLLIGGKIIPISRAHRSELMERIMPL